MNSSASTDERGYKDELASFEAWCCELEGPLYGYLARLVQSCQEAEELAQETLLRLFRMWQANQVRRKDGAPRPLAFSIAHNLAIDAIRRRQRTPRLEPQGNSETHSPRDVLLQDEIAKAVACLPEQHRAALLLREYGELRYAEIAHTMDASTDAVKVWVHRARKRLAQLLDREGQFVGNPMEGQGHGA